MYITVHEQFISILINISTRRDAYRYLFILYLLIITYLFLYFIKTKTAKAKNEQIRKS